MVKFFVVFYPLYVVIIPLLLSPLALPWLASPQEGLYLSILILLALAAFFTIFGGLSAVIWTDFVQAILMVVGALVVMATGGERDTRVTHLCYSKVTLRPC